MTPEEEKKTTNIAIEISVIIGFFFFALEQFMDAMGPGKYILISLMSLIILLWNRSEKSDEEVKQDGKDIGDKESTVENEEHLSNKSEMV